MAKMWVAFSAFTTPAAAANATMIKIIGTSGKSFEVVEIGAFGAGATAPADIQHNVNVGFMTNATAGTPGASPAAEPMMKASAAPVASVGVKYSAESTAFVTNVFQLFSFNQRGGMRWSVPVNEGFRPDPATNFSFGARVNSSSSGTIDGNAMYWE